jgi:hypothetical protein
MNIAVDKHRALCKKLGRFIQEQRLKVFQETELAFSERLNAYSESQSFSERIVQSLESGDDTVPLSCWLYVWQIMQVADKTVDATKSDTSLFLAASERLNLSAHDVQRKTPQ